MPKFERGAAVIRNLRNFVFIGIVCGDAVINGVEYLVATNDTGQVNIGPAAEFESAQDYYVDFDLAILLITTGVSSESTERMQT